jgi:hypothetical protein
MKNKFLTLIYIFTSISWVRSQTLPVAKTNSTIVRLPQSDYGVKEWKKKEFIKFDPSYMEDLAERTARTSALYKQVVSLETANQNTALSHQILSELIWLISSSADFKRIDDRLADLKSSLYHPENERQGELQDSTDGSWGKGYNEWIFKVIASYPHLKDAKNNFRFIDRINSPQQLTDYLTSVSVSNIALDGIDHQREFNEALSNLMRMILRDRPKQYAYDPKLKETLMHLLSRFRNPETGYWGERYVKNGHTEFVDDLSITFHIVSYLNGNLAEMNKIVATTLAVKDMGFPVGPVYLGQRYDHLNMDIVELFRLGWPQADSTQKMAIRTELEKLLQWCLTKSLQPDGSFKMWTGDNSREESTYYGASFLVRMGFFDKSKRFWTNQEFPNAKGVRNQIVSYINKHLAGAGTDGEYYQSALEELNYKPAKEMIIK